MQLHFNMAKSEQSFTLCNLCLFVILFLGVQSQIAFPQSADYTTSLETLTKTNVNSEPTMDQETEEGRAAKPLTRRDCYCQCKSLKFKSGNKVFGNCESEIGGKEFCMVEGRNKSPCPDKRPAARFRGEFISFHACATKPRISTECQTLGVKPPLRRSTRKPIRRKTSKRSGLGNVEGAGGGPRTEEVTGEDADYFPEKIGADGEEFYYDFDEFDE